MPIQPTDDHRAGDPTKQRLEHDAAGAGIEIGPSGSSVHRVAAEPKAALFTRRRLIAYSSFEIEAFRCHTPSARPGYRA
jgi:hypothetical protein